MISAVRSDERTERRYIHTSCIVSLCLGLHIIARGGDSPPGLWWTPHVEHVPLIYQLGHVARHSAARYNLAYGPSSLNIALASGVWACPLSVSLEQ